ncbi:MAG: hypothetical protein JJE22_02170 [Bacteroidia bacterium]|nr:hypothetical protein [Bacteroidia bacterium]
MKKVWQKTNIVAFALIVILTTATASVTLANDSTGSVPSELKYLGITNEQLVFQLNIDGTGVETNYTVLIVDKAGNTLYRENVKGEKLSKRFLINSDLVNENELKFQITNRKSNETVVYQVNQTVRTIQDVVVNKLK